MRTTTKISRLRTSLDVKRTESLRGITVFRGQLPGSGSSKVTTAPITSKLCSSPHVSGHAGVLSLETLSLSLSLSLPLSLPRNDGNTNIKIVKYL